MQGFGWKLWEMAFADSGNAGVWASTLSKCLL